MITLRARVLSVYLPILYLNIGQASSKLAYSKPTSHFTPLARLARVLRFMIKYMGRRPCELVLFQRQASTSHFTQAVVTKRGGMVIASENNQRGKEATKNSFAEDMQTLQIQYAYSNSCWNTCSRLSFLSFFFQTANRQDARSQGQGKRAPAYHKPRSSVNTFQIQNRFQGPKDLRLHLNLQHYSFRARVETRLPQNQQK